MKFGLQQIVFVLAMLGLLAGSYFFIFQKDQERRALKEQDMATKKRALADLEHSTAGINDLDRKLAELQQAIAFFESKLPAEKEIDKILQDIWEKAKANSLEA